MITLKAKIIIYAKKQCDNPLITFKVMLYLCSLLTENGLNEDTYTITCDDIQNKLSISNVKLFENSLLYLSSISFDYKVHSSWYACNILTSYKHFKDYYKTI